MDKKNVREFLLAITGKLRRLASFFISCDFVTSYNCRCSTPTGIQDGYFDENIGYRVSGLRFIYALFND